MRPLHLFVLVVMNVFWAGTYSAFKALSASLTTGEIVTLRYSLATLPMLLLWPLFPGAAPRRADAVKVAVMGILVFAVSPRLQVLGVQLGKAGDSSIVMALEPLVTAVAAALFLREHTPLRRWVGFSFGLLGILLINGAWQLNLHGPGLVANLLFLLSFTCEAAFSVIGKPVLARASILKVITVGLAAGSAANLAWDGPSTWAQLPAIAAETWIVMAYLSVLCTVVGYSVWYVVIRETDVSLAALTILLQPPVGVAIAAVWLHEALHWGQLWGTLAVVVGLIVGLLPGRPIPLAGRLETDAA